MPWVGGNHCDAAIWRCQDSFELVLAGNGERLDVNKPANKKWVCVSCKCLCGVSSTMSYVSSLGRQMWTQTCTDRGRRAQAQAQIGFDNMEQAGCTLDSQQPWCKQETLPGQADFVTNEQNSCTLHQQQACRHPILQRVSND